MMKRRLLSMQLACGLAIALAGCSTKGPDVVDPNSNQHAQNVLFAVDKGGGAGELYRYNELGDVITPNDYESVNGAPLGKGVDAIYENDERLFLHHRETGEISMLDLKTRKLIATFTGLPGGVEGQLCSMAFSNYSQAWVVCYNSPNLYQIDQVKETIADTFELDGNPTNVATQGTRVFVSTEQKDGTAKVSIFESNFVNFAVEKTLALPSPVIYAAPTSDGSQMVMVTAGGTGVKPKLHFIRMNDLELNDEVELESEPLTSYIGKEPNFASYSRSDYLYLALPSAVVQFDVWGRYPNEWLPGNYPVLGVDYGSDLLYVYTPGSMTVKRVTIQGEQLSDVNVPADVRAIFFLGTDRVVR